MRDKTFTTDINEFYDNIKNLSYKSMKNNKQIEYIELPCSFDIETSSFYDNGEKRATMYAYMININHVVYFGRTWDSFEEVIEVLQRSFKLFDRRRLIIFVHNLSYEFQFMSKIFIWDKVFALEERKVVYCITDGIEFRCSYILSGYSLDLLAKIYNLPVKKLSGKLDYKLIRLSNTPLTDEEIEYLYNDTEVIIYYIELILKSEYSIGYLPLTKTAYVRRYTKKKCSSIAYKKLMKRLTIEADEYMYLKQAFAGGFTHANMFNSCKVFNDVYSYDFTSSYPAVMVSEMFPLSKGTVHNEVNLSELEEMIKYKCCIIDIEFKNIESTELSDHPISASKCKLSGYRNVDNGRIIEAESLRIVITEQDYITIKEFYKYDEVKINKVISYYRGYLPKEFVETILELYKKKTELKGVENRDVEYLQSKEMVNSLYGMTVTDILRDEIIFDDGWSSEEKDVEKAIKKYNNSANRFLFYPWGVWVTAYARRNLFTAIKELGSDYIYADTDSVKFINPSNHSNYFMEYNNKIKQKIIRALNINNIPIEMAHPKTIKNEEKWLGVWDFDGKYDKFKTLGAKRYMLYSDDKLSITVSGLNKKIAVPYILSQCNNDIDKCFKFFDNNMYIPKGKTGKNIHTYIDDEFSGYICDYLGVKQKYSELSAIHLDEAEYSLKLCDSLLSLIMGVMYK